MKKLIVIAALLLSINSFANGQAEPLFYPVGYRIIPSNEILLIIGDSTKPKQAQQAVDTTITQSTPLLTYGDWQEFTQKILSELPEKYTIPIRQFMEQRFEARAKEFIDSKKKQK